MDRYTSERVVNHHLGLLVSKLSPPFAVKSPFLLLRFSSPNEIFSKSVFFAIVITTPSSFCDLGFGFDTVSGTGLTVLVIVGGDEGGDGDGERAGADCDRR